MSEQKPAETEDPNTFSLEAKVEALLFVSPSTVSSSQLAAALDITPREVDKAIQALEEHYTSRGIRIQRHRGKVQLTTAPEAASFIETLLSLEATTSLSNAARETLSIIAYQQPVTRPQIDIIRGVNSDSVIRNLLSKGLIEEAGRSEGPGRPIFYVTTTEFLQHFGLSSIKELPPLQLPEPPPLDPSIPSQPELPLHSDLLKD